MPHILSKAVERIYTWLLEQFKAFPFNGADRFDGVDLWIYARFFEWGELDGLVNEAFSTFLSKDMTLLSEPIDYFEQSVKFSWNIINCISKEILGNSEFLGKYAMTEDRYLTAGIRILEGLLEFHLYVYPDFILDCC